jgi:hypothetical protein
MRPGELREGRPAYYRCALTSGAKSGGQFPAAPPGIYRFHLARSALFDELTLVVASPNPLSCSYQRVRLRTEVRACRNAVGSRCRSPRQGQVVCWPFDLEKQRRAVQATSITSRERWQDILSLSMQFTKDSFGYDGALVYERFDWKMAVSVTIPRSTNAVTSATHRNAFDIGKLGTGRK